MNRPQPFRPPVALLAVTSVLVLVGIAMIIMGLPEASPLQRRVLELSTLPFAAAVTLGVVHLGQRLLPWSRFTRGMLVGTLATAGVAAAGMAMAGVLMPAGLLHPAQLLMWIALGVAWVYVTWKAHPARDEGGKTFHLSPDEPDEDQPGEADDEPDPTSL